MTDEERAEIERFRRSMVRIMVTAAFAAGVLTGILFMTLGVPTVWMPVVVLAGAAWIALLTR